MTICDKEICIGCGVCENVCSTNACKLLQDDEGFLSPEVDETKCSKCNLCKSKCPALLSIKSNEATGAYAYYTGDKELRRVSSSGGVFSDIAKYVINEKKGVVVGAAYTILNENSHYVKHIIVDNVKDLSKLRGSKYVQSDTREALYLIKKFIDSGRVVLFTGTPCQISAVKSFIGDKDNLYTVDLFCHGVPSPKIFSQYLEEMNVKKDSYINFKDKSLGWNDSCITYETDNFKYKARHSQDTFYLGFVDNLYLRNCCYSCKYNKIHQRPGDISIGDFWDIEKIIPELNDDIGINAVISNTTKGEDLIQKMKPDAGLCQPVSEKLILPGNSVLETPVKAHSKRTNFFNDFNKTGNFFISARKYLNVGHNILLLNHSFSHDNYGAMMVAYSMERIVEKLGYNPTTLLFHNPKHTKEFDDFKTKYLHTTKEYELGDFSSLVKLNKTYDTFITGSDQVWRNWWYNNYLYRWYIDFADSSKNIISYAASFGFNYFDSKGVSNKKIEKLLKSYSGISVREKSGVDICKNCFNTDATWVVDPTQLLEAKDYEKIIEGDKAVPPCTEPYLAYMIFPEDENATEKTYTFINELSAKLNLKPVPLLTKPGDKQKTIGEWLATIKNASFIVTESFHGTMFSIIFKRPMLVLALDDTERNRLPDFFERINFLQERILYSLDDEVAFKLAKEQIDWDELYRRRKIFQNESLEFLRTALAKQVVSNGRTQIWSLKSFAVCIKRGLLRILPRPLKTILKGVYFKIKK